MLPLLENLTLKVTKSCLFYLKNTNGITKTNNPTSYKIYNKVQYSNFDSVEVTLQYDLQYDLESSLDC